MNGRIVYHIASRRARGEMINEKLAEKGFARSYRINLRSLPELAFSSGHDARFSRVSRGLLRPHPFRHHRLDERVSRRASALSTASARASAARSASVDKINEFHPSALPFDFKCLVDRDVGEVFGLVPFPVCPHDADAPIGVLVDSVYRPPLARAEARIDDAGVVLDEERFELPLLEMLARRLETVAVDLYLHCLPYSFWM